MKRILASLALLAVAGLADAVPLQFNASTTATRTEQFNGVTGLPTYATGTTLQLGALIANQTGTITFTYLGQESGYNNWFNLLINGTSLFETNAVGTTASAFVSSLGAVNFQFVGASPNYATNGGYWSPGTSIGLIGTNTNVTSGAAAGNYQFILGYNDSAGSATLGDWDDFVVGVNFTPTVPEPGSLALLGLGLAGLGFARRRKTARA